MKTLKEYFEEWDKPLNEGIFDNIKNKIEIYKAKKELKQTNKEYKEKAIKEHRDWMFNHLTDCLEYWKKDVEYWEKQKNENSKFGKNYTDFCDKMMASSMKNVKYYEKKLEEYI